MNNENNSCYSGNYLEDFFRDRANPNLSRQFSGRIGPTGPTGPTHTLLSESKW